MYAFREIASTSDLERYCLLRSTLYGSPTLASFLQDDRTDIDLDCFDLHARHYGLYCGVDLVGGVRVIVEPSSLFNATAFELGIRHGIYDPGRRAGSDPAGARWHFPFVRFSHEMRGYYERWRNAHPFCEAGRFVIHADHRGSRLARFAVECATVAGMIHGGDRVCLGVTFASYPRAYRRYGYDYIGSRQPCDINGLRLSGVVGRLSLDLAKSSLPASLHARFDAMTREFTGTRQLIAPP